MKYALFLTLLTGNAFASGEAMFSKGHSTWTVAGVDCTTGTAVQVSTTIPGFNTSGIRLQNQDADDAVWIGYNSSVATHTASGNLGEKLSAGSNGVWEVGKNPDIALAFVQIWCKAADAAGAGGVRLSRAIFGYK